MTERAVGRTDHSFYLLLSLFDFFLGTHSLPFPFVVTDKLPPAPYITEQAAAVVSSVEIWTGKKESGAAAIHRELVRSSVFYLALAFLRLPG